MLEGGKRGFAFASGMAAISSVFHALFCGRSSGGGGGCVRGNVPLFDQSTFPHGNFSKLCRHDQPEQVAAAIRPDTKAIYLETPSNPTLKVTDIAAVCSLAKQHGLLTIVDNTFMTPYYQRPLELGADIVIHSATKFIGGHSDVVAGLVVTRMQSSRRSTVLDSKRHGGDSGCTGFAGWSCAV